MPKIEIYSGVPEPTPQVFINGRHVGGYDALYALDRKGELADWLARV